MENAPKETAKDLFLHLLSAATLYLSVIGFITLWWQYINFLFPDKLHIQGTGTAVYEPLLWANSILVVTFPVYVLVSWIIGRDFKKNPLKREAGVRKWLWYITLFISAMTIIIDLVTLVFNFLKGDLTTQFFLKLIVILIVAGAVFGYYLWDLKKRKEASGKPKKAAWISGVIILVSIIYGFFLVGSPAEQRDLRFDEQRIMDLQQIQGFAIEYWQQKKDLPQSLNEMSKLGYRTPTDPETGEEYQYIPAGELSFRICASFNTVFKPEPAASKIFYYSQRGVSAVPQDWEHGIGLSCFDITIDKDFYEKENGISPTPIKEFQ
ncbi:MAG: DUF5671 domain-containing protein [Candidatus Pacebacteria bacterium]|nr:DUF5671 domain-containing protein [Candidatus Paceibacterota bacterium]